MEKQYKYNGYTFIEKKKTSDDFFTLSKKIKHNPTLNEIFNKWEGTYDYDDFYKKVDSQADIFAIKEMGDILVIPSANYLFEYIGD